MKFIVSALIAVASATEWQQSGYGGFSGLPDKDSINLDIDKYLTSGGGLNGFEASRGGLSGFDAGKSIGGLKEFEAGIQKGSLGELRNLDSTGINGFGPIGRQQEIVSGNRDFGDIQGISVLDGREGGSSKDLGNIRGQPGLADRDTEFGGLNGLRGIEGQYESRSSNDYSDAFRADYRGGNRGFSAGGPRDLGYGQDRSSSYGGSYGINFGSSYGNGLGYNDYGRDSYDYRRSPYDDRSYSQYGLQDSRRGPYDDRRGPYDDRRGSFDDRRDSFDDRRGYYDDRRGPYDDDFRRPYGVQSYGLDRRGSYSDQRYQPQPYGGYGRQYSSDSYGRRSYDSRSDSRSDRQGSLSTLDGDFAQRFDQQGDDRRGGYGGYDGYQGRQPYDSRSDQYRSSYSDDRRGNQGLSFIGGAW